MAELEPVRACHRPAVRVFEVANRRYFSSFISDRGDAFFEHFDERFVELLAEQEAGTCAFFVLIEDGEVLGRFNLVNRLGDTAELGYRVAERAAGRGVATATVQALCRRAANDLGLRTLRAAVADSNPASQRVLVKAGFVPIGPADAAEIGGKTGTWYGRDLTARPS